MNEQRVTIAVPVATMNKIKVLKKLGYDYRTRFIRMVDEMFEELQANIEREKKLHFPD